MSLLLILLFFILGTIIGSFLNVLVVRSHDGDSLGGRSACVHCHKQIPNLYLIPVFGYLLSGRRCFLCHKPISVRYLIGELILGMLFAATYYFSVNQFFYPGVVEIIGVALTLLLVSILFYISYYDILYQEIPTLALGLLLVDILVIHSIHGLTLYDGGLGATLWQAIIGMSISVPFLIIWLLSRGRLIGFGDILIMALMGLHLGLFMGASAVLGAFWLGSIFGVLFIMYQKIIYKKPYTQIRTIPIAFGPFLMIAWFITHIYQYNIFRLFL